jgi:hypothetical protein
MLYNIRCMRTTLDLDPSVLRELKERGVREGKSIGKVASALLAQALSEQKEPEEQPFKWNVAPMRARVDLSDRDAVYRALDET